MAAPLVTVDARMLRSSGIGTYLGALLPRLVARLGDARFCLLGRPSELEAKFAGHGRVELRELSSGVYSAGEQLALARAAPRDTSVFWSPHVNVPIVSPGRLLVTVHDAFYLAPPEGVSIRLDKRLYLAALMRVVRRRAASIVCVSAFTASELRAAWPGIESRLVVAPNGVDRFWFETVESTSPHERPYLLYVGNLKPHKNVERTLSAFSAVASRLEHDFLLCGIGDPQPYLRRISAELRARVRFVAPLEPSELKRYVAHASGLVLASLYEGFGLPPLEAMALGVPVLVSRAASLPEVCGDAALYCDPYSVEDIARGLETLLCDAGVRAELVRRGPERARLFDWERSAERTERIIRTLLP